MRIVTFVALLALGGHAMFADAAREPARSPADSQSINDRGGKQIYTKKDASVVRTRSGTSARDVSETLGRG